MNGTLNRLGQLESRFERLRLEFQDVQRKLAQATQQIREQGVGSGGQSGGSAVTVYEVPAGVVISAGGSATADVYVITGGSSAKVATAAAIYNTYAVATTSGKALTVGSNGDGTYTVIGQSC